MREVEPPRAQEVCRQPREVEVPAVDPGAVHQAEREQRAVAGDEGPGHRLVMGQRAAFGDDHRELGRVHSRMLGRVVAEPAPPGDRPEDPEAAEEREHQPPAHVLEETDHEWLARGAAERGGHDQQAERTAALAGRQPARKRARGRREHSGLTHTEEEPHREQRHEAGGESRGSGHDRPPDHDARQRHPGSEAVGEPAARDLEQRVGQRERAEDESHLGVAEAELRTNGRRGRGDADPVEVGDRREGEREADGSVPRAARRQTRHRPNHATYGIVIGPSGSTAAPILQVHSHASLAGARLSTVSSNAAGGGCHTSSDGSSRRRQIA